ncbi:MAG: hypothetical protein SGBAC_005730 [Bacillariaceae sp.]
MNEFEAQNGRQPTKEELVTQVLEQVRTDDRVLEMIARGIKVNADVCRMSRRALREKTPWDNTKTIRMLIFQGLIVKATDIVEDMGSRNRRLAYRRFVGIAKFVPGLNLYAVTVSAISSLAEGKSISQTFWNEIQGAIPIWKHIRNGYSILKDFGIVGNTPTDGVPNDGAPNDDTPNDDKYDIPYFDDPFIDVRDFYDADTLADDVLDKLKYKYGAGPVLDQNANAFASAYLDPHFVTLHGIHYAYHGECDMVFLRSSLVEIHIRTKSMGRFSEVVGAALRIGDDIVEFSGGTLYINGTTPTEFPEFVGGSFPLIVDSGSAKIVLSGGQFIHLKRRVVSISAHGSDFYNSTGMAGTWTKPGFVARDGCTTFDDSSSFAQEWEVNHTLDDPNLFQTPAVHSCGQSLLPILDPNSEFLELAETLCGNIVDDDFRKDCIFDVATTGDATFASDDIYTEPWKEPSQCSARSDECANRGGRCVWRCNLQASNCVPGLCGLAMSVETFDIKQLSPTIVEGCSCSIPFGNVAPSDSPSESPSLAPSESPSQIPSMEPSMLPSDSPSVKPTFSRSAAPDAQPSIAPSDELTESPSQHAVTCGSPMARNHSMLIVTMLGVAAFVFA